MEKIRVMCVFGTRPEAIKMAPLVREMGCRERIDVQVMLTGQHREMLDQVMGIFGINADADLNIMHEGQTLADITVRAIGSGTKVMADMSPDLVLVHGDTTTTFCAALSAFYNRIPVGHVEAGLRTYDRYSPYPEEMNRQMVSRLASYHFAPTVGNRENLKKEGITNNVFVTGNTVIDAVNMLVRKEYSFRTDDIKDVDFSKKVIMVTAHRRENLGQGMINIANALYELSKRKDTEIVYPVHLNPAVRQPMFERLSGISNVHLIDPIDVDEMHNLIARSYLVLTDSGGLQEEAPALGKPVIVMRNETERPEAVEAGTVKIAGVETDNIVRLACELMDDPDEYDAMAKRTNPYGDGKASMRIADAIEHVFLGAPAPEEFG